MQLLIRLINFQIIQNFNELYKFIEKLKYIKNYNQINLLIKISLSGKSFGMFIINENFK